MKKRLFISKLCTIINASQAAHKHQEPILFAQFVSSLFDEVYILGEGEDIGNIKFISNSYAMSAMIESDDKDTTQSTMLLWQDDTTARLDSKQQSKLYNILLTFSKVKYIKRFALLTDLRYKFDAAIIMSKFGIDLRAVADDVTELTQAAVTTYKSAFINKVYLPLQIVPAVEALDLCIPQTLTVSKFNDAVYNDIQNIQTLPYEDRQYDLCFATAGMTGLDDYRYGLMYKFILQLNRSTMYAGDYPICKLFTTHIDRRMAELFLADKSFKRQLSIEYAVAYKDMPAAVSNCRMQLAIGAQIYKEHQLISNKYTESILAGTIALTDTITPDIEQHIDLHEDINVNVLAQYSKNDMIAKFIKLSNNHIKIIDQQELLLTKWIVEAAVKLQELM